MDNMDVNNTQCYFIYWINCINYLHNIYWIILCERDIFGVDSDTRIIIKETFGLNDVFGQGVTKVGLVHIPRAIALNSLKQILIGAIPIKYLSRMAFNDKRLCTDWSDVKRVTRYNVSVSSTANKSSL